MNPQRKRMRYLIAGTAIAFTATAAFATLVLVKTSTKTKGVTTVTWTSSWKDLDYTVGNTVNIPVSWTVNSGAATFDKFVFKKCTPRSKRDPAKGTMGTVTVTGPTSINVPFTFSELHLDKRRNVEIGNAHFKLLLKVQEVAGCPVNIKTGYGVNLHVEDPQ